MITLLSLKVVIELSSYSPVCLSQGEKASLGTPHYWLIGGDLELEK